MIIELFRHNLWSVLFSLYITESRVICACVASEEDNLQGWFFAEDDGNQIKKQKHPLLLRQMPVVMSKLQEFKVRHVLFVCCCVSVPAQSVAHLSWFPKLMLVRAWY